jgi:Ca2+-binding RTX toxin-like protein
MRRILLVLTTMAVALVAASGVAYALSVQCDGEGDQAPDTGACAGTAQDDTIIGTEGTDFIDARGGDDRVEARGGEDFLFGRSGVDLLFGQDGNDHLFGHGRGDTLVGGFGINQYFGASGPDNIFADASQPGESEAISAGPGNDTIFAFDGQLDVIDCGSGTDTVTNDPADQFDPSCDDL